MAFDLFASNVFWAIVIAAVVAQGLKILIMVFKYKEGFHPVDLVITGGMPSQHTALVTSLTLIIYLNEGFSTLFFVAAVLAGVVIRDALGVRRTAGQEGQILNEVIKRTKLKLPRLHYSLGHTPKQVIVGFIIGLLSAAVPFIYFTA